MKNSILSLKKHQLTDNKQPVYISKQATTPEFISISYCPRIKYLHAKWSKNVNSYDLRHAIRLLARAIALLRAELVLIELPVIFVVAEEDRNWVSSFLREAMRKLPIRRVARVLPNMIEAAEIVHNVVAAAGDLPYEARMFEESEQATKWLLEGQTDNLSEEEIIRIPLNFNMKLIRSEISRRGKAEVQMAPTESGQRTSMSVPLPDRLQVRTDFVSISIDQSKGFMNMHWLKVPHSRQYRYGMLKAIRAVTEHRLSWFLLNNQRLGALTLEDQGWLINTAQRMLPKTNLKKLAMVTSPDALQQMSSETVGCKLKQANPQLETRCFLSEEDATEWLQSDK
jgi:hypothetical protein